MTGKLDSAQAAQAEAVQALQDHHEHGLQQLQQSILQAEALPAFTNIKQAAERCAAVANGRLLDSMCKRHSSQPGLQQQALACLSDAAFAHPFSIIWAAASVDQLPQSVDVSLVSLGAAMPKAPSQFPAAVMLYDPGQTATAGNSSGSSSSMSLLVLDAKDSHIKADLYLCRDLEILVSHETSYTATVLMVLNMAPLLFLKGSVAIAQLKLVGLLLMYMGFCRMSTLNA